MTTKKLTSGNIHATIATEHPYRTRQAPLAESESQQIPTKISPVRQKRHLDSKQDNIITRFPAKFVNWKRVNLKKQDEKAAKILSAILGVFILTWLPYNVVALMYAILGESGDDLIPGWVWSGVYYLCYLNSTINPVCYALCNVNFRKTYFRILKCNWSQPKPKYVNMYN